MLRPIAAESLDPILDRFCGRTAYLHVEVTPGCFLRNLQIQIEDAVLRHDGTSFRLALRCKGHGWVVMEGLTHMVIATGAPLQLCSLVEEDRLTRLIQLSEEAFAA